MKELLFLFSVISITAAQGVCTIAEPYVITSAYYVQTSYYYSYSCGFWGLSRCSGTSYGSSIRYRSDTYYNLVHVCCSGYHDPSGGINCEPYCENCDSNHICIAPYTCVCPVGWTGDDCMEDIDECLEGTSGCEQVCINKHGSYTCDCHENYTLGYDAHSCLGPPQNVSLTASSSTSLHLDWIEPELDPWDGTINEYGINCTSHFGYYHYSHIGSTQWYYDIFGLKPFSYYTCCVNAMTTNGDSTYTCDMEKTLQDVPGDAPQNLTARNQSIYAILIEWQSPTIPNGIITLYTIYADYNNGSNETTFMTNSTERSFILDGLTPYQLIGVNMSASTIIGEGPVTMKIYERTSQSAPSEVTEFEVISLSPNDLYVSWNLPEYLNGILTKYKIVVYNEVYNQSITVFIPVPANHTNISEIIEPFVPYTVEISAFTQAGEGNFLQTIVFSEEGVPSVKLNITMFERVDATSFQLSWDALTYEELRGFLDSYVVIYDELSTYECLDLDILTSEVKYVNETFINIEGLIPGKEYCVEVAAQTSAGLGNFTKVIIPLYDNLLFQVHFYGIHKCAEWVHEDSLEKVDDFIEGISLEMSKNCSCYIPVENFANERLICEPDNMDKVVFQARLVVTKDKNDTEMLEILKDWVITDPHLVIQGVQLEVDQYCSVELYELGNGECVSTTEPPPTTEEPTKEPTDKPSVDPDKTNDPQLDSQTSSNSENVHVPVSALGGGIAAVIVIMIIIIIVIVFFAIKYTRANKRHIEAPNHNLPDYFAERTVDNPLYKDPTINTGGLPSYDELDEEKDLLD